MGEQQCLTDRGDQLALPCPRERGFFGCVFFSFVPSPREIIPGLPRRHEVGGMVCALLIMELVLGEREGNREGVWAVRAHLQSRRCPLGPRKQRRHMDGQGGEGWRGGREEEAHSPRAQLLGQAGRRAHAVTMLMLRPFNGSRWAAPGQRVNQVRSTYTQEWNRCWMFN